MKEAHAAPARPLLWGQPGLCGAGSENPMPWGNAWGRAYSWGHFKPQIWGCCSMGGWQEFCHGKVTAPPDPKPGASPTNLTQLPLPGSEEGRWGASMLTWDFSYISTFWLQFFFPSVFLEDKKLHRRCLLSLG